MDQSFYTLPPTRLDQQQPAEQQGQLQQQYFSLPPNLDYSHSYQSYSISQPFYGNGATFVPQQVGFNNFSNESYPAVQMPLSQELTAFYPPTHDQSPADASAGQSDRQEDGHEFNDPTSSPKAPKRQPQPRASRRRKLITPKEDTSIEDLIRTTTADPSKIKNLSKAEKKKIREYNRKLTCYNCQCTSTPLWRRSECKTFHLCNSCGLYYKQYRAHRPVAKAEVTISTETQHDSALTLLSVPESTPPSNSPVTANYSTPHSNTGLQGAMYATEQLTPSDSQFQNSHTNFNNFKSHQRPQSQHVLLQPPPGHVQSPSFLGPDEASPFLPTHSLSLSQQHQDFQFNPQTPPIQQRPNFQSPLLLQQRAVYEQRQRVKALGSAANEHYLWTGVLLDPLTIGREYPGNSALLVGENLPMLMRNTGLEMLGATGAAKSPDLVFLFHVDLKSNAHMTPARYIMDATTTAEATTDEVVRNILDLSDLDFSTPQLMVNPQAFVAVAKPLSLAVGVAGGEEGARVGGRVWQTGPGTGTALGHIGRGNTLTHSHSHQIDEAASPKQDDDSTTVAEDPRSPAGRPLRRAAAISRKRASIGASYSSDDEYSAPTQSQRTPATPKNVEQKNLVCFHCQTTKAPFWRRTEDRKHSLCNACGLYFKKHRKQRVFSDLQQPTQTSPPPAPPSQSASQPQLNTIHTQIAPVIPSSPVSLTPRSQSAFHSTPVTSDISVRRRYSDYSNTGPIGGIPSMPQGMLSADFSALAEVGFSGSSSWLIPPHQPGFDPSFFPQQFQHQRVVLRSPTDTGETAMAQAMYPGSQQFWPGMF
ncbi:putative electron transfer flavoprotein subunit [Rhizoclosmatium sp. JEL0117]|nr:putative electron transfer flavoprotein subunit [Rhizoclosmatium sp. JEL0117]